MSFLLTEVALEMMGCKFYDINGVCREMNLQGQGREIANEPNLAEILGFPKPDIPTPSSPVITETVVLDDDDDNVPSTSQAAGASAEAALSMNPELIQVINSDALNNASRHTSVDSKKSEMSLDNMEMSDPMPDWLYQPDNLFRSITYDYKNLTKELLRKREIYANVNPDLKNSQLTAENIDALRKAFIQQETQSLDAEIITMREFREFVLNYMDKLNPNIYKDYLNMFQENNQCFETDHLSEASDQNNSAIITTSGAPIILAGIPATISRVSTNMVTPMVTTSTENSIPNLVSLPTVVTLQSTNNVVGIPSVVSLPGVIGVPNIVTLPEVVDLTDEAVVVNEVNPVNAVDSQGLLTVGSIVTLLEQTEINPSAAAAKDDTPKTNSG